MNKDQLPHHPPPAQTPEPTPEITPSPTPEPVAEEIPEFDIEMGKIDLSCLSDDDTESCVTISDDAKLTVKAEQKIGALYLTWYDPPACGYKIEYGDSSVLSGHDQMRVKYVRLDEASNQVSISCEGKVKLSEIRVFTLGTAPDYVQDWQPPCEQGVADVLVFPTHSDDDVIFFGGLIAQCVDRGLSVQVCYMVEHASTWHVREFERLNALWAMGVRNYPVIGPFQDYILKSLWEAQTTFGERKVSAWQVEQIRRFQPLVAVGHDRQGEYGHGAHMINAQCLESSVPLAADSTQFPESADTWGVWNTPKLYLHYAEETPISLDLEIPLDSFDGRTAFEVAQDAMNYHQTQLRYPFRPQLENSGRSRLSCREFGLVRTLVGGDTGSDIMENIETSDWRKNLQLEKYNGRRISAWLWKCVSQFKM